MGCILEIYILLYLFSFALGRRARKFLSERSQGILDGTESWKPLEFLLIGGGQEVIVQEGKIIWYFGYIRSERSSVIFLGGDCKRKVYVFFSSDLWLRDYLAYSDHKLCMRLLPRLGWYMKTIQFAGPVAVCLSAWF